MQIVWKRLYKQESSRERGTLTQLRNLINRRNVSEAKGKDVKNHVNEIEDFLVLIIECHLIADALNHFAMSGMADSPHSNSFRGDIERLPLIQTKSLFNTELEKIINTYVVPHLLSFDDDSSSHVPRILSEHSYCQTVLWASSCHLTQQSEGTNSSDNPHLSRIQCDHSYYQSVVHRRYLPVTIRRYGTQPPASLAVKKAAEDGVFNYALAVLGNGLLLLELKDAIREGDGLRILRCWKVMLMYFTYAGHRNYQHEAFYTLSLVNAIASPQVASQITCMGSCGEYKRWCWS